MPAEHQVKSARNRQKYFKIKRPTSRLHQLSNQHVKQNQLRLSPPISNSQVKTKNHLYENTPLCL